MKNNSYELYHYSNGLTKIENIPNGLSTFACCDNPILRIKNFPDKLKRFYCQNTEIVKIENLPNGLTHFDCRCNGITKIENLQRTSREPKLQKLFNSDVRIGCFLLNAKTVLSGCLLSYISKNYRLPFKFKNR